MRRKYDGTEQNKAEQQREYFNEISEVYYKGRKHANFLLWTHLMWKKFFDSCPDMSKKNLSVLEPMCGSGDGFDLVSEYIQPDFAYEGFDYSEKIVAFANQERPGQRIWQQNVLNYEPDKEYDLAIMIGALHHVPNQAKDVMGRISKALKKGAYFINYEPTNGNILYKYVREGIYRKNDIFDYDTERGFSIKELNDIFIDNNMEIVHQMYPGLLSFVLYANPYAFPKLNIGGERMVRFITAMDSWLFNFSVTKYVSFITMSLCRKK